MYYGTTIRVWFVGDKPHFGVCSTLLTEEEARKLEPSLPWVVTPDSLRMSGDFEEFDTPPPIDFPVFVEA